MVLLLLPARPALALCKGMLYFDNAAASLTLHPAGEYVRLVWKAGALPEIAVQQAINQVLVAWQTYNWQKLLVNHEFLQAFSVELQVWLQLDWCPRAVQAGYRYGAVVQARDVLVQMATLDVLHAHTEPWPRYQICAREEDARAWLVAQPRVC